MCVWVCVCILLYNTSICWWHPCCCWILCCDLIHFLKVVITVYRHRCLYLNKTRRRWIFVLVAGCLLHLVCGIYFHHFVINYLFAQRFMWLSKCLTLFTFGFCVISQQKPNQIFIFSFFFLTAGIELATLWFVIR